MVEHARPGRATGPGRFQWKWWWKQSHLDSRYRPAGCEAAFALYHFLGMLGISEAQAEGVASSLKRYSPALASRLGTDRIIEKVMLRNSGVAGDGSDDVFILRCWAEYFGGLQKKHFRFHRLKRRGMRYLPLSGGSQVISTIQKKQRGRTEKWIGSPLFLKSLPLMAKARKGGVMRGARAWERALARSA